MQPKEIIDQSGDHRVAIHYEPAKGGVGFNFHKLVWSHKQDANWTERAVITKKDFEHGTNRRHWIQEMHSFDPSTGYAIFKVGEEDGPRGTHVHAIYSWQEWDVLNNRQVRLFRICKKPHEVYEPSA